ncbi:NrfD/PsrC family molybdoenzyme membrane anchor subunit [Sedimenticola hydrogenitrophicus]|uniref:NrfD/PsrC family molybdoenzyme membrane anchor subunit n=1 Tax=Sedimenticola hydrogenitrophicus TaxID=2967975 RepID=UPI0023B18436|nr:NrfD/PsrC family molybdoenzyme membrane anchor subunit [Sedimenticola hydrogenitrophicus]
MFEYMEYNIAPWGAEIVIYFFLIGVAAMTFVYAAAPAVFGNVFGGVAKSMEPFQKVGLIASFVLLLICGPLLIMDLGQPSRFLYPILYFHWTSPLSWGSLFLPLFGLCIIGFYFGLVKGNQGLMRVTGILGSLLALSMPLYTGLDLMVNQTRELWSNPTIPLLFVILSMSSGTAVVAVIQLVRGQLNAQAVEFLHAFLYLALAVTFALFLAEWVVLNYGTGEKQQAWEIINQQFGFKYWGMTFLIGILAPLVLVAMPKLGRDPRILTLAAVLSAVGAYSFREVLIYAGQLTQINF